jgi:hypothetical protein
MRKKMWNLHFGKVPMLLKKKSRFLFFLFFFISALSCSPSQGQAALLLEEPYGFFGAINPTGHNAMYFARICAETPTRLRRCEPEELGTVIARYQGISTYDWIAVPLIPYLYSVETAAQIPTHVDREQVSLMRERYFEAHLQQSLGDEVHRGNLVHGGWTQLLGTSFERRTYVFRFDTTPEQDDALIESLNSEPNRSHFNLFYNNCADFARLILNQYYPRTFRRNFFPDAGMTTPKQITYKLVHYARKHPEAHLQIFKIEQIPGYRRASRANKSIAESLTTTAYAVPILILNPYLAGGIFADYLARGRFKLILHDSEVLKSDELAALTDSAVPDENPASAQVQAPRAAVGDSDEPRVSQTVNSGLQGKGITNE